MATVLTQARQPLLARLGQQLGLAMPRVRSVAARVRSLVLQVSGLGMVVAAAWMVAVPLGALVGGVSLLVLEHLTAPEGGGSPR